MGQFRGNFPKVLKWNSVLDSEHFEGTQSYNVLKGLETTIGKACIFFDEAGLEKVSLCPIAKPAFCQAGHPLNLLFRKCSNKAAYVERGSDV